jgi:hypothetical protein
VTIDDDAVGGEVQTSIALVVRGVAEEEATSGARRKLVRCGSRSVRVAGTTEHTEVVTGRGCAVQGEVGVGWLVAFEGRRLRRCVAVCRASAQ